MYNKHKIKNKNIGYHVNLFFLPFFFNYFRKKYQMLAPWNGSHQKTGSGYRVLEAAALNFVVKITQTVQTLQDYITRINPEIVKKVGRWKDSEVFFAQYVHSNPPDCFTDQILLHN